MRLLLGIILGALLTIGGAYLYDSHKTMIALEAPAAPAASERPLVNWDVVSQKWGRLSDRARAEWNRLAAR